jgi:hypothetical protein
LRRSRSGINDQICINPLAVDMCARVIEWVSARTDGPRRAPPSGSWSTRRRYAARRGDRDGYAGFRLHELALAMAWVVDKLALHWDELPERVHMDVLSTCQRLIAERKPGSPTAGRVLNSIAVAVLLAAGWCSA